MWKGKVKWFAIAAGLSVLAGGLSFTRYFMDTTRLASNPQSNYPIIRDTANMLKTLKSNWQTVESGYAPDFSAANSSLLLEKRDVIPWIIDDVGEVMASATQEANRLPAPPAGPKGLILDKLTTMYTSAGSTWDPDYGGGDYSMPSAPSAPQGPGGRGRADAGTPLDRGARVPQPPQPQQPPPSPAADGSSAGAVSGADGPKFNPGEGPPRVIVTMTVKTTRDDVFEFLTNTAQKWLNANKEREAVPYSIKFIEWKLVMEEEVPKDPNAALAAGQPGIDRLSGRETGPGRPGAVEPNQDTYIPPADVGRTDVRAGDVNQLAPIPKQPPIAPPGTKIRTFEITWQCYLKDVTPSEGL
jgi:hypothetical protein